MVIVRVKLVVVAAATVRESLGLGLGVGLCDVSGHRLFMRWWSKIFKDIAPVRIESMPYMYNSSPSFCKRKDRL